MTRTDLYHWIEPYCLPDRVSIMYPKSGGPGPGWTDNIADSQRAKAAWLAGKLSQEPFDSSTAEGTPYRITRGQRLGLVAHRLGFVGRFCIDLDAHEGGVDTTGLADRMDGFLGAKAIRFTSKSGRGLHLFYALVDPMPVTLFVAWAQSWGFNRAGQPECFPKTEKLSQVWLPNEANENGGDKHLGGDPLTCIVQSLPVAPTMPSNVNTPRATPSGDDDKPGTLFARSTTPWSEILTDGSVCVREIDGKGHWRRPGKHGGQISGTTGVCRSDDGRDYLYVFSSNWHPFEPGRCYDKFQAYALLRHGGDFAAAASELGAAGWGAPEIVPVNDDVDFSEFELPKEQRPPIHIDENAPSDPGEFPASIAHNAPGILGEIIRYDLRTAMDPQPGLALAAALASVGTVTGRKIAGLLDVRTNLYVVGLAPSGCGKQQGRAVAKRIFTAANARDLVGPERIGSHAGILSRLVEHPATLMPIDEIGDLFALIKNNNGKMGALANIEPTLKALFSAANDPCFIGDALANKDHVKQINHPHLVIHGVCPAHNYWGSLTAANVENGLIARFIVIDAGDVPSRRIEGEIEQPPKNIVEFFDRWFRWKPTECYESAAIARPAIYPRETVEMFYEHREAIKERQRREDERTRAIWNRCAEKASKLALIAASSRVVDPVSEEVIVTPEDMVWGKSLAIWSTRRMSFHCFEQIGDCAEEDRKKAILRHIPKKPGRISAKDLGQKTKKIEKQKRSASLSDLIDIGLVVVEKEDSTGGRPAMWFSRPASN